MTTTTPEVTYPPAAEIPAAAKAHKALTNRWASTAAVVIAILWTIPTAGLLISSFRPQRDVQTSGWWTFFTDPKCRSSALRRVSPSPGMPGRLSLGSPRSAANSGYCAGVRPYFSSTASGVILRMSETPRLL